MINRFLRYARQDWLWLGTNIAAAVPVLWLLWDYWRDNLSINPIDDLTNRTGSAAIFLLVASLAVTPLFIITGYNPVTKLRRSLGLWAFGYVALHLLVFVGVDYAFSLHYILLDGLPQKPYIIAGFVAFLLLIPLALTSTRGWMKRLGRNWKRLHRLAYAAGVLGVLHYIWVKKVFFGEPVVYAVILALLLAVRIPPVRRAIVAQRQKRQGQSNKRRERVAAQPAQAERQTLAAKQSSRPPAL
jgi:methionine sulfoxide reductase heme-binding subunit